MGTDTMTLARDERASLTELLETLTPEQWESPTLCEGWTVRDVVAHVLSYEGVGLLPTLRQIARARFVPTRANDVMVAEGSETPEELLAKLRRFPSPVGFVTTRGGGTIGLVDGLIHQQDIRRPLGRPREIPEERLVRALALARIAPPVGLVRARGLRFVATDVDWSAGKGPLEVRGPGEPMLMAIAGRQGAVEALSGNGSALLAQRIGG